MEIVTQELRKYSNQGNQLLILYKRTEIMEATYEEQQAYWDSVDAHNSAKTVITNNLYCYAKQNSLDTQPVIYQVQLKRSRENVGKFMRMRNHKL